MSQIARGGQAWRLRARTVVSRPPVRLGVPILLTLMLAALSAYAGYRVVVQRSQVALPPPTAVAVTRGTLTPTQTMPGVTYAGTQAKLSFSTAAAATGAVVRSVDVELGQQVAAGQPLVALDNRSATRAVEQASASLEAARITLNQLMAAAPSDVAAAVQLVASASAALQRAQNDRSTLRRGSGADAIASASQAALTTQNALAAAQTELDVLVFRANARATSEELQRQLDAANAQLSAAEAALDAQLADFELARGIRPAAHDLTHAVEERCREACLGLAAGAPDLATLVTQLAVRTSGMRELAPLERSEWSRRCSPALKSRSSTNRRPVSTR